MFSYCKRTKSSSTEEKSATLPFAYHTSKLNTVKGFGRPNLCPNLHQPFVQNRGIPRRLLDLEDAIKGRDRTHQPLCQVEQEEVQFSTFRPPPVLPRGIPGTAPVPIIEVRGYGGSGGCNHAGDGPTCGNECRCSSRCQCKGPWRGMNPTRPHIGPAGFCPTEASRIYF